MQSIFPTIERQKKILDFWFSSFWDRNSEPPSSLFSLWFGSKFESGKMISLSSEEQKQIDVQIKELFEEDLNNVNKLIVSFFYFFQAAKNYYGSWKENPQGKLALIILNDQFPRNIYRGTGLAFNFEEGSLSLSRDIINNKEHKLYKFYERVFIYLPLEHSEKIEDQDLCVKLFKEMEGEYQNEPFLGKTAKQFTQYADLHRKIVADFGRFPHRNKVLGRENTEKENEYLANGGHRFGQ